MSGIALLNPWLLLGLAGASLPIIIHLIGRRRAPTVRFAAFDFLLAVNKRLARRERLRQFLLLLLRTLAIIALVFAVARPMPDRPAVAAGNRRLVIVIDASASMAYRVGSTTLLEEAKRQARDLLSHLQPGEPVTLVIAGREVRVPFQSPTVDHDAVAAAIEGIETAEGVADFGNAIDTGLSQLGTDGSGAVLAIVSDLSQNSFASLRPSNLEPAPEIRLIDAASPLVRESDPVALGNVAIETVRVEHSSEIATERRFVVTVRNHGAVPVSGRVVELVIDDQVTHRGYLDVPARGVEEKTLTHNFDGPGIYTGVVRLVEDDADGYHADDEAGLITEVARSVRVLAVNGDPRTTPYEDELFFIERALQAIPRGEPPIALRIITVDELPGTELADYDVVLLANVASLSTEEVDKIRGFLGDGKGLMLSLGDRVKFEAFNEKLGALLPHPLRDLHRVEDENAGTPPIGVGDMDWDHPILAGFGLALEQSLRASRTSSYFNLDVGSGVSSRAILRFENGAPALVERRGGSGRVILLTTSVDVDLSDIALRSGFPALMQRTVRYLANSVASLAPVAARVGGTVEIAPPTGAAGIALTSPSGVRREVMLSEGGGRRAVFRDMAEVGLHSAEVSINEAWQRSPRLDVVINPSLEESDFMPVSTERVSRALGGEGDDTALAVLVGAGAEVDPFEARGYASYLLMALCLLFVGESLLASRG